METTKIHDPVVLSSGSIPLGTTQNIAIAVGAVAVVVGGYAAYKLWKGQRR